MKGLTIVTIARLELPNAIELVPTMGDAELTYQVELDVHVAVARIITIITIIVIVI